MFGSLSALRLRSMIASSYRSGALSRRSLLLIAGLVVMSIVVVLASWPQSQSADERNTQRISDINAIIGALTSYADQHSGERPACLQREDGAVHPVCIQGSRCAGVRNGCDLDLLLTTGLTVIPVDPLGGMGNETRYTIAYGDGVFVVAAPMAENGATISLMR